MLGVIDVVPLLRIPRRRIMSIGGRRWRAGRRRDGGLCYAAVSLPEARKELLAVHTRRQPAGVDCECLDERVRLEMNVQDHLPEARRHTR